MRIKPRQSICARRPQHQARACGPARRSPQRHGSASSLDRSSAVRKSRRRDGDRPAPPPTQRDARASLCLCGGARADDHEIIGAHDLVSSSPVACVRALAAAAPSRPAGFGENDPRTSAEGDIGPQPIERDDDARAEAMRSGRRVSSSEIDNCFCCARSLPDCPDVDSGMAAVVRLLRRAP